MDDVTFGCNEPYGDAWTAEPQPSTTSGIVIPGQCLMSRNALFGNATMHIQCNTVITQSNSRAIFCGSVTIFFVPFISTDLTKVTLQRKTSSYVPLKSEG